MPSTNPLLRVDDDRWFEADPRWWRAVCGSFDRVVRGVAAIDGPRTIRVSGLLGQLARRAGLQGPSAAEVRRLFPFLTPPRASAAAREIAALRVRNRVVLALVLGGHIDRLAAGIRSVSGIEFLHDAVRSRRPALFVEWHIGAVFGITATLHREGLDALVLRNLPVQTAAERTRALGEALDSLRRGRPVVTLLDAPGGSSTGEVVCLDRRIVFRRGPFMLARVTGAPMYPVTSRWERDGRRTVLFHPPLEAPAGVSAAAFEEALAARAAAWLDGYLRDAPEQIWPFTLYNFLAAPPAAAQGPLARR